MFIKLHSNKGEEFLICVNHVFFFGEEKGKVYVIFEDGNVIDNIKETLNEILDILS